MEVITGNWIMTLFCGYFKYNHIMPILDNFFLDDWKTIFSISLSMMKMFKDDLMKNNDIAYAA